MRKRGDNVPNKNYYEMLGVSRTASKEEIHKAFRKMIKQVHADINNSPNATEEMRCVIDAYKTLSDEEKKQEYDRILQQEKRKRENSTKSTVPNGTPPKHNQNMKSSIFNIININNNIKFNFVNYVNIDHNDTNYDFYDFGNEGDYIKVKRK